MKSYSGITCHLSTRTVHVKIQHIHVITHYQQIWYQLLAVENHDNCDVIIKTFTHTPLGTFLAHADANKSN